MKKILFGFLMVMNIMVCRAQVNNTNTVTIHIGGHVFTLNGDIDLGAGNLQQTIVEGDSMITKLPNITIITNSKTHTKDIYINGGAEDMSSGTGSTYMNFGGTTDSMFNNRNFWGINIPDFSFNWYNGNLPGNVDSMMGFNRRWMDSLKAQNQIGNMPQQYYYQWHSNNDRDETKEELQEKLEDLQDKLNDMQDRLNDMQNKINKSSTKNSHSPVTQDTTHVRVGNLRIQISHSGVEINPSDSNSSCSHVKTVTTHWILLDIGFDTYLNNFSTNLPAGYSGLELIQGKSVNVNLQLFQQSVNLYRQHLFFAYGLGFDFYNYRFRQNTPLVPKIDFVEFYEVSTPLSKSKLSDTYLTIPILFQYESCTNYSKSFHLGLGMNVGYLITSHTKQVSAEYGKVKDWDSYNLNSISYGPILRIGFSWFNLYANYGLNGVFRTGSAPLLNPLSFGISIIAD